MAPLTTATGHPLDGTVAEWIWLLPLLPLLGATLNGAIALRAASRPGGTAAPGAAPAGRGAVTLIGPGVLLLAFALAVALFVAMRGAGELVSPFVRQYGTWQAAGTLRIDWALQLDQLSLLMTLVITGVGLLIHVFSVGYMAADPGFARYFAYLNLFVAMMLVLVLGASYPVMFVGWEGVGLASYLLIGFWFSERANADAGRKAFIVNRVGDVGFLLAMFLVHAEAGSLDFLRAHAALADSAPGALTAIALLLLLGGAGKSAQLPLHLWLPDAMAGPTPVSALMHAATMVTAGVYLVARAATVFAGAPEVSLLVALVGAVTALFAATVALRQWDIKKVLAYSTISQLGYMFVGVGTGAYAAGIFHLVTHAFFKALLFLGAGAVIHALHAAYHHVHDDASDPQDLRNMGGLGRHLPRTAVLMWIGTLAIAGVPPLSGFFSKDEILTAAFARAQASPLAETALLGVPGSTLLYVVYGLGLATALLTAVYMTRLMLLAFAGPNRTGVAAETALHEAPAVMGVPLAVLGVLTIVAGWLNLPALLPVGPAHLLADWLAPVTGAATRALAGDAPLAHDTEIVLVGTAIAAAVAGLGVALARYRRPVPAKAEAPPERGFAALLHDAYRVEAVLDRAVVRPLAWLASAVLWRGVDRAVERLYVQGGRALSRAAGAAHDRLGGGDAGRYAWAIALGVLAMLAAFTVR
jgi:NADH-quinone oxidoreductase subunit L